MAACGGISERYELHTYVGLVPFLLLRLLFIELNARRHYRHMLKILSAAPLAPEHALKPSEIVVAFAL